MMLTYGALCIVSADLSHASAPCSSSSSSHALQINPSLDSTNKRIDQLTKDMQAQHKATLAALDEVHSFFNDAHMTSSYSVAVQIVVVSSSLTRHCLTLLSPSVSWQHDQDLGSVCHGVRAHLVLDQRSAHPGAERAACRVRVVIA